jgi:hypothetical protein
MSMVFVKDPPELDGIRVNYGSSPATVTVPWGLIDSVTEIQRKRENEAEIYTGKFVLRGESARELTIADGSKTLTASKGFESFSSPLCNLKAIFPVAGELTKAAQLSQAQEYLASLDKKPPSPKPPSDPQPPVSSLALDKKEIVPKEDVEPDAPAPEPKKPDPEDLEKRAQSKVKMARQLLADGKDSTRSLAIKWLEQVVKDYPETESAKEAQTLLRDLEQ